MCLIVGRWNICFSHCYQLNVCSAHPAQSRPVLLGSNQGSLPWDSPFLGNAHRIFSFLFLRCTRKILPWGNIKGFPDISQRNRCTYIWFDKNGGYVSSGHSSSTSFPLLNNFNGSLRKLPSSVITVSIINLNALVWNSSSFTIWPQLTFLTILCTTPIQDPARLSHLLFPDPQSQSYVCLWAFFNLKQSSPII